ncbi:hypothetical protein HETIRDRAFT_104296 [Heterobasidion irregulare TC 32-1]|uniref:Uncharacterized protein n=1 Tax=Heterobasidion irregulare (strain TC 32-1) TaxID=747525 RepID=W4K1K7_HETIT|nr:uncharacterized protein HETIRDRAFT_104296 [Heterobasidion irregulare TC 32-1]ETW78971.1 hypothetical protein HETIRDRAFT_104296 [Heterobasidion irregulare TC 32-1]
MLMLDTGGLERVADTRTAAPNLFLSTPLALTLVGTPGDVRRSIHACGTGSVGEWARIPGCLWVSRANARHRRSRRALVGASRAGGRPTRRGTEFFAPPRPSGDVSPYAYARTGFYPLVGADARGPYYPGAALQFRSSPRRQPIGVGLIQRLPPKAEIICFPSCCFPRADWQFRTAPLVAGQGDSTREAIDRWVEDGCEQTRGAAVSYAVRGSLAAP